MLSNSKWVLLLISPCFSLCLHLYKSLQCIYLLSSRFVFFFLEQNQHDMTTCHLYTDSVTAVYLHTLHFTQFHPVHFFIAFSVILFLSFPSREINIYLSLYFSFSLYIYHSHSLSLTHTHAHTHTNTHTHAH